MVDSTVEDDSSQGGVFIPPDAGHDDPFSVIQVFPMEPAGSVGMAIRGPVSSNPRVHLLYKPVPGAAGAIASTRGTSVTA